MIRKATPKDINEIADIWLTANLQAHNFIPAQYWTGNLPLVKEMFSKAEIYVYLDDEIARISGFIGLNENYVEGIFVQDKARSKGIGKQLLNFAKQHKKELKLNIYKKNRPAIKFYQREGFAIESENTDSATGEQEYIMIWQ